MILRQGAWHFPETDLSSNSHFKFSSYFCSLSSSCFFCQNLMRKFNWLSRIHSWGIANRFYREIKKNMVNFFLPQWSCFLFSSKTTTKSWSISIGSRKCWDSPKGLNSCEIFLPMLSTKATWNTNSWQLIKAPAQPFLSVVSVHTTAGDPTVETLLAPGRFPPTLSTATVYLYVYTTPSFFTPCTEAAVVMTCIGQAVSRHSHC